ncbi:microprocessor complex subunit DGCR8 [Diabrotica virgifera virgifera]|uniref:Microprocessor complex subunit DGCR8 n=1 Tax=Diabrotica virgifera virgifera TaxID=50390 RepID=A0A6P7GTB5_DIAVI|nr:microprocessor complex subunit DGCR8 [Diabrotica virgifera virgifera]
MNGSVEASQDSSSCPFFGKNLQNGNAELNKFHILDETEGNDDTDNSADFDSDIPDDEIEKMLEEALEKRKRKAADAGLDDEEIPFEEKNKILLIEKGQNHFDVLPEGWIQVTHNSGMPIYLQKVSRVCSLSRPYFLGPGSARKHHIPVNAIPCLNYRKALEKEESESNEPETNNHCDQSFPNAKIETVQENLQMQNLPPEQVREYCEKLFKFQTMKVLRFKSWSERRKFTKRLKQKKQLQRLTLPDGTKLITFPIRKSDSSENNTNSKKEWVMNPNGKSYVCILHEYVQHVLKKQPTYQFTELENAATPYAATVIIKDMRYGVGYGTSKKQAKSDAAKATLEILIPEMKSKIVPDNQTGDSTKKDKDQDLSFFDEIRVEDPRVFEFCAKTTEPAPYDILLTCLQRNFGLDDLQISYQGNTSKSHEFTMTVGKHTATVSCKNKRDGKQRASQAILQALHPSITSWGSLLRLYGNHSIKSFKEKKLEEQEITSLQSKAAVNQPNYAILSKLNIELGKLREKRKAIQPIGVLDTDGTEVVAPFSSTSNLHNLAV